MADERQEPYRRPGTQLDQLRARLAVLEAARREQERVGRVLRFTQFAIERTSDAAFWMNSYTRLVYVNEAACRMLGYSRNELRAMTVHDIATALQRGRWAAHWERVRKGDSFTFETDLRTKEGRVFPAEVSVNFVAFEGEEYNCAFVRDITARKETESAICRAKREWERTFDTVPDLVCILDAESRIRRINRSMADRLGMLPREAIGKKCFACVHKSGCPPGFCPREKTAKDGCQHQVEMWAKDLDSWFSVTTTPLKNGNDDVGEVVHVMRDITQLKRTEEERIQFERRMQETQKLESLGVLAAGIAHDFNNALAGILGYACLAMEDTPSRSPIRGYLQNIESGAQRAAELCQQMLAYAGKGRCSVAEVDLGKVIQDMAPLLQTALPGNVLLHMDLSARPPLVHADPNHVRQVVMNLVLNASEAIAGDDGAVTVSTGEVEADEAYLAHTCIHDKLPEGCYATLTVSDNGTGMEEKVRRRIFEPFFTTKFQGRGLGMSAVLGIVRRHKGTLRIDSEPGKGTVVEVLLPALAKNAGAGGAPR